MLIERLERATGASRELDAEIAVHAGVKHRSRRTSGGANKGREWLVDTESGGIEIWSHHPPRYTASVDAALTLVPEGRIWSIGQRLHAPGYVANLSQQTMSCTGATPALALCIAALKARP